MAGNDQADAVNTAYPNPPTFWQAFTADNLAAYKALGDNANENSFEVPTNLESLHPPTPPANGEYNIFGEKRSLDAPLPDLPEDTAVLQSNSGSRTSPQHLLNLSRSILLSYMEMMHVLSTNASPEYYGGKWTDLQTLFRNLHHGVNTYRPWQARDALIKLLEQTRDNAHREIAAVGELKTKVDEVLRNVARECEEGALQCEDKVEHDQNGMNSAGTTNGSATNGTYTNGVSHLSAEEERQQALWRLVNEDDQDQES